VRRSERLWGERVLPGFIEALNPRRVALKRRYVWIFVHTEGNSDGYRLALYMHEGIHLKEDILFSRNSLKVLEKLLKETLGEVEVGKDENFAHVKGEGWKLSVRLLEGEYPDYMAVIPTDYTLSVLLDKNEFENALQRLSSISSSSAFPVKITFSSDVVQMEISDPEFGEGKDEVDVLESFGNEAMEIGFNGKYLLEALRSLILTGSA